LSYVPSLCQIELIDFGATREYSKRFMDDWLRLLQAAIDDDKAAMVEYSRKLKYLLGGESQEMVDAHVTSMSLLGGASPGPLRRISGSPPALTPDPTDGSPVPRVGQWPAVRLCEADLHWRGALFSLSELRLL
jgi:hypothetical protein